MIEGIGVDVVEIARIRRTIDQWSGTFLNRVFTEQEISYAQSKKNPTPHLAARFAVKEAVAKALTTGWSGGFRWKDVEVQNNSSGKPCVILNGHVRELLKGSRILVSISHSENVVIAFAIIEKEAS
ncbi:MAG: holo-ACP synthase [Ignavibacteria bacterium]|nr:holo-ACP synthase [Ignavibacteria bacterium]